MLLKDLIEDKDLYNKLECDNCKINCIVDGFNEPYVSYECLNGHKFCIECWLGRDKNHLNKCLNKSCSLDVPFDSLVDNEHISELFSNTRVFCKNNSNDLKLVDHATCEVYGCTEVFPIKEIKQHQLKCEFESVQCEHKECCGSVVIRKNLNYHNENYMNEVIKCLLCSSEIKRSEESKHLETCEMVSYNCSYCSESIVKKYEANHLENCKELPISCQICNEKIKRKDMDSHNNQFIIHTNQVSQSLLNNHINNNFEFMQLAKQVEELSNQNNEFKKINQQDESVISSLKDSNNQLEIKLLNLEKENSNLIQKLIVVEDSISNINNSILENNQIQLINYENKLLKIEGIMNKFKNRINNIQTLTSKYKGTWAIQRFGEPSISYGVGNLEFSFRLLHTEFNYKFYNLMIEFKKKYDSPILVKYSLSIDQIKKKKGEKLLNKEKSIDVAISNSELFGNNAFYNIDFYIKVIPV